jgi:signal transduction histidine kinase
MFLLAGGLLGLIVLLATLQYRWLGQISEAERERTSATLRTSASAFAEDFDRELNRAFLLFQISPVSEAGGLAGQMAERVDRWQATARFPRLIKEVYSATSGGGAAELKRFNPSTRFLEPAEWPAALEPIRAQIVPAGMPRGGEGGTFLMHAPLQTIWPDAPALVVSSPLVFINRVPDPQADFKLPSEVSSSILLLDGDYIRRELLPSLAQRHFQAAGESAYELAVVPTSGTGSIYRSVPAFNPRADAKADASADLFRLRVQDFGPLAAEISRFTLLTSVGRANLAGAQRDGAAERRTETVIRHSISATPFQGAVPVPSGTQFSFIVKDDRSGRAGAVVSDRLFATGAATANARMASSTPHWRLLVKHPSGSLEQAVGSARRRNLLVSTGILGVLAISVGFLVVSTRRAHDLARRQLEFVATVSHELRTPLAVIRSAADNLADGVVGDEARVRQYGQLVRREGLRLSELVEQILEFAGLQSGQRAAARQPVTIDAVLRDAVTAAQGPADAAGVRIELAIADGLPPVAGDPAALRRVFLNLIGNAVKYGAAAGWVGVRAGVRDGSLEIAVSDRGIGIAPAEQAKIFEPFYRTPDVVAAQIQGAGLGLSLVRRIVEAHGGTIAVTSAPGEGSTFTVTLPAMAGDASADASGVSEAAPQHS